jgi:molybdopterin-guanine dinucleotide biosynthesis protein A
MNYNETKIPVCGCVLAGGGSTRMGSDKALLEIDSKPLIIHALESFAGFSEILISAKDSAHDNDYYAFTGALIIPDERPGLGPLGGFVSVLKKAAHSLVCFRPVDAPFVPAGLHLLLMEACAGKDAAVPVSNGKPEPLLACFSKTALPVLETLLSDGDLKAADAFPLLDTACIPLDSPEMTACFGDPSTYLININDPETFAALRYRHLL